METFLLTLQQRLQSGNYLQENPLFTNLNKQYETSSDSYNFSLDTRYTKPYNENGEISARF